MSKLWHNSTLWQKKTAWIVAALLLLCLFVFSLPQPLFQAPTSTILYSAHKRLIGARIAADEQWRFPARQQAPNKFKQALICFEDQHFYKHPGVNPLALLRALQQNWQAGKTVSGGSTLSMQLIRLSRPGKARSLYQKMIEMWLALRLECSYSKEAILALYASHAPFGGNVVGIDAAAWRYYGRSADELSWAEAATLAVLPNAPSLIFPGKNTPLLIAKRNRLLAKMLQAHIIDSLSYRMALLEKTPSKIDFLPRVAPHLLDMAHRQQPGQIIHSSIDYQLQTRINKMVAAYHQQLMANKIHNAAVLVADIHTGQCLAYVGNTPKSGHAADGHQVDIIQAARSTGSILKPFLYAGMLDDGRLMPTSLVADIPTQVAGYSPKNFNLQYAGAVPADKALARSLNVPAVRMLRSYGVERFHHLLQQYGMHTLQRPPGHYGLALVLGGAEGSLWDIAGMYANMVRSLHSFVQQQSQYRHSDLRPLSYLHQPPTTDSSLHPQAPLGAGAIYHTLSALRELNRPDGESGWRAFASSQAIAWKTGTSFGFRDAWAVGLNQRYVVGVWVGNADGEGRPGLTGVSKAAPLMFQVFDALPATAWFAAPHDDMAYAKVCSLSGYMAGRHCTSYDSLLVPTRSLRTGVCPYHHLLHLDASQRYRVNASCMPPHTMVHKAWFVLPPAMEWYYKKYHPLYKPLPPLHPQCHSQEQGAMDMIYPRLNTKLFIPIGLDGSQEKIVFKVAHQEEDACIFWYLDDEYVGSTTGTHQKELAPAVGRHMLSLTDEQGRVLYKSFTIVGK